MQDGKLVNLLGLLTNSERTQFTTFLESPYFNRREDVRELAELLMEMKESKGADRDDAALYTAIYGETAFDASRFNNLKTLLRKQLLRFLSQTAYEADPVAQDQFLLRKLNAAEENKYFPSFYKKGLQRLEKADLQEADRYTARLALEEAYIVFVARRPQRGAVDHLQTTIDQLGNGFLLRMYKLLVFARNHEAIFGTDLQFPWKAQILDYVAHEGDQLPSVVKGYRALYMLLEDPETDTPFLFLRRMLAVHSAEWSRTESLNLYIGAINYAVRRLNDGHLAYLTELFELYKELLATELLLEKGKMPAFHFKNILNVALRCRDFEWAQDFLQSYSGSVGQDYRNNLVEFSEGLLRFHMREFEAAERHFHRVLDGYKDIFYGLDARAYLLQIYYETGDSRGLESLAHSFRMFLDRSKGISGERRRQYNAFIRHLRQLSGIPLNDKARYAKLKAEILKKDAKGMGTKWLLEKIESLES